MIIIVNSNPVRVNTLKRLTADAYLKNGYMVQYNLSNPDHITIFNPVEVNQLDRLHKSRNKAIDKQIELDRFNDSLALLASMVGEQVA